MPLLLDVADLRAHVETDLADEALTRLLEDADAAIVGRFGPHSGNVTDRLDGGVRHLHLSRPATAVETVTEESGGTPTVLVSADYRLRYGGRTLERRPVPRRWAPSVEVVYTPVDDTVQRTRVIVDLVKLAVNYDAAQHVKFGDFSGTSWDYKRERERLLSTLSPDEGIVIA